jgi:hypothetical protein
MLKEGIVVRKRVEEDGKGNCGSGQGVGEGGVGGEASETLQAELCRSIMSHLSTLSMAKKIIIYLES